MICLALFACGENDMKKNPISSGPDFLKKLPDPGELNCGFGVDPTALAPITTGISYVALSDEDATPYPAYLYDSTNSVPTALKNRIDALEFTNPIRIVGESMSSGNEEYDNFIDALASDPDVSQDVIFENLAESKLGIDKWLDGQGNVSEEPEEVQVVIFKHTNNYPQDQFQENKRFPDHAVDTKEDLIERCEQLQILYPNLKLIIMTSRTFGGWTCNNNPGTFRYLEPVAYEEGFSVKWAIEELNNDTSFDIPVMWGPYYWQLMDEDWFEPDQGHPASGLNDYVVGKLMDFFKNEPTVSRWFLADTATVIDSSFYSLTVNVTGPGSVAVSPIDTAYLAGQSVQVVAQPDSGALFSGWAGDLVSSNATENIIMDEDKLVTASFDTLPPSPSDFTLKVNCGGSESGEFLADVYFESSGSFTFSTNSPIAGTSEDEIYQTVRGKNVSYSVPSVPDGDYILILHYALYQDVERVFDVKINGLIVDDNYSLSGTTFSAISELYNISISGGQLDLELELEQKQPLLAAFELIQE